MKHLKLVNTTEAEVIDLIAYKLKKEAELQSELQKVKTLHPSNHKKRKVNKQ